MRVRGLKSLVLGLAALAAATGVSHAAGPKIIVVKPDAADAAPAEVTKASVRATIYDRVTDPTTAAIRAILKNAGSEGSFLDKRDAAAVAEYYAEQGYAPGWTNDAGLTDRARAIIRRLAEAAEDGLDPRDYRTPSISLGQYARPTVAQLAEADVMLSEAIATYARHAYSGRLDPSRISSNFDYKPHLPDSVGVLSDIASADDPAAALAAYNPTNPEYVGLRAALAEARAKKASEEKPIIIPEGPTLKLGMSDPRVPLLRQRLKVAPPAVTPAPTPVSADASDPLAPPPDPASVYDATVVEAVKTFQTGANLKADGIAGKGTLAALNRIGADNIDTILVNMERWRWMPRDLGEFYVRVDIPAFKVDVIKDGMSIYTTRTVVGKAGNQTPIFSNAIDHIVVNPAWNVPASIATKEMLPQVQANPAALSGYEVFANIGGRFRPIDPTMVDWFNVDMRKIQIRQPPGERNALGSIKFMFPNAYAVYLHDTPSKSLFQRDFRAFSHGCVRVMDPMTFADALLVNEPSLNAAKLEKMKGGPERRVNLTQKVPVHLTYFTAWVGEDGTLDIRDDVYGHDARMKKALAL